MILQFIDMREIFHRKNFSTVVYDSMQNELYHESQV